MTRATSTLPPLLALLATLALLTGCGKGFQKRAETNRKAQRSAAQQPEVAPFEGRDAKEVRAAFPGDDRLVLEQPDKVTLFTLNPVRILDGKLSPEPDRLRTYGITGQAVIDDTDEHRMLVEAVYRGLRGEGAGPAACFNPRHGLRFERQGRTIECLICFECTWIYIYGRDGSDDEVRLLFGATVEPVFASLLKAHGLVKAH